MTQGHIRSMTTVCNTLGIKYNRAGLNIGCNCDSMYSVLQGENIMVKQTKTTKKKNVKSRRTDAIAAGVERLYAKSAPLLIAEALLLGVTAILMAFWPVAILTVLTFVIGAGLILFGLYRTIAGFVVPREYGGGWFDVLFGLINVILGVLFCVYPVSSIIGLAYVFIILFIFKALRILIFSINMARVRFGHYVIDLIISIALVALAFALLFWPMAGAVAIVYYLAISMLLYAAADVYMYIELLKLRKKLNS